MLRRSFLRTATTATAALSLPAFGYSRILGANDLVRFAVVGVNGRGQALISAITGAANAELAAVCDVDSTAFDRIAGLLTKTSNTGVDTVADYRRLLERSDIDAVAIATPEHWHMPMAMMALKAGKHIYLEKPCSFNPAEGEMLVAAQEKYGGLIQMGNQQRSAPTSREAIDRIHEGALGRAYVGKAWYSNRRGSIGIEKPAPVPAHLDWELWQGPAPRRAYAEPWVHYNWHWHRLWGTGEINNNGTHEIDICRWALQENLPVQVASSGGRFHFDDAWQWYDTQYAHYTYADNKMITWDGRSCNPATTYNRGRGAYIGGTKGYAILDRGGAYFYGMDGELTWERREEEAGATLNTIGAGPLDLFHMSNFVKGITESETLHSPIADARLSQWHCHVGNIAQDLNQVLTTNPVSGHVEDNPAAMAKWSRVYEPGWAPVL